MHSDMLDSEPPCPGAPQAGASLRDRISEVFIPAGLGIQLHALALGVGDILLFESVFQVGTTAGSLFPPQPGRARCFPHGTGGTPPDPQTQP